VRLTLPMNIEKRLDDIFDTKSKIKIVRLFVSRREDFIASGREIAALTGITPPAAHTALKELYGQDVLRRTIVGRQHLYQINPSNRTVKEILRPVFQKEQAIKEDIKDFLLKKISEYRIKGMVVSAIIYGSVAQGKTHQTSDCDVAIVVKDNSAKKRVEDLFIDKISGEFSEYFGISLDAYVKTCGEFTRRIKKNLSPVSALIKSYVLVYGKDPMDYK
jgi:predicted nucleotidyltransferase